MKYLLTLTLLFLFAAPTYAQVSNTHKVSSDRYYNARTLANRQHKQRVVMYSSTHCPFCKQARQYFRAHNIPYLERNIDRSNDALHRFTAMNAFGTPTLVHGKRKLVGFGVARFRQFYR